jgi:hypothetical protein
MEGDIKEVVGVLMRVLSGGEVSRDEVGVWNSRRPVSFWQHSTSAYIKLLEFAFDHEARLTNSELDRALRAGLQDSPNNIVRMAGV